MYGIMLILVLVICGGMIAVIGDRLGSKIGKRRFSIFGWRPRDTATFVTIITGIMITSVTFLLLSLASDNVRTALFGMEQLNATIQETQDKLRTASDDLATARQAQGQMNQALKEADAEVKALQEEAESLKRGNDALRSENANLMAFNDSLVSQNAALAEGNAKLTSDNESLERQTDVLRQGLATLREGAIAFQSGEVIASGVIRAGGTEQDIMAALSSLIQLANRNVSARLKKNTSDEEIWIYSLEYDAAVERIKSSPTDMIVRIVAAGNLIRGEAIRTRMELYPNSIIYRKDEYIFSNVYRMPGGNEQVAEEALMDFLQKINKAASSKGILPDPIRGSIGVMEGEQFYGVLQAITPVDGYVRITAYAQGDTDAAGPLRLNLSVEKE